MTATLLGSYTLAGALPVAASAHASLEVSLAAQLPELQAKLTGMLEAQAQLTLNPPSLTASLDAATALVTSLQAAIALGLPSASIDLTAIAGIVAELQGLLGDLQLAVAASADIGVLLATPGVYLVSASSMLGELGNDVGAAVVGLGAPSVPCNGVMLLATDAAAWAGIQAAVTT